MNKACFVDISSMTWHSFLDHNILCRIHWLKSDRVREIKRRPESKHALMFHARVICWNQQCIVQKYNA